MALYAAAVACNEPVPAAEPRWISQWDVFG